MSKKTPIDPPDDERNGEAYRFRAGLDAAQVYVDGSFFARVPIFTTPFSKQYKLEIRGRNPQDAAVYDRIDQLQRRSALAYTLLRLFTGLLFAAFLALSLWFCWAYGPSIVKAARSRILGELEVSAVVAAIALVLAAVRRVARWAVLEFAIGTAVERLANAVSHKFSEIVHQTNAACGQMDVRADHNNIGLGWPKRAGGSIKIALWNAKRSDFLDNYTTAAFWKMQVFDTHTERGWRLIKGLFLLVALFGLFYVRGSEAQQAWLLTWPPIAASIGAWLVAWYVLFLWWGKRMRSHWLFDFLGLLVLYAILAGFWIAHGTQPIDELTPPLGAIFVTAFWFGWIVDGEKDDSLWTDNLTESHALSELMLQNTSFYFNSIAGRIQNLVDQIIDKDRSFGTRGDPKPPNKDDEIG